MQSTLLFGLHSSRLVERCEACQSECLCCESTGLTLAQKEKLGYVDTLQKDLASIGLGAKLCVFLFANPA